jgi:hypothetical protein
MINNDSEPALNPELAEKHARELQESYETALRGEGEDSEGDEGVQVGEDDNGDEDPAGLVGDDLMDVDGPSLFSNTC